MPEFATDVVALGNIIPSKDNSKSSSKKLLGCTVYVRSWRVKLTVATELTALVSELDDLAKHLFDTPVVPDNMNWDEV